MALILASASAIRRAMLEDAGIAHLVRPADIDEEESKRRISDPSSLATDLACRKALAAPSGDDDWVIGSDSVVSIGSRLFDKPRDRRDAADHLRAFSGKSLTLTSAVALAHDGTVQWSTSDCAKLDVRPLSDAFIESYLDAEWPQVAGCVGVFRMEGRGVQLFDRVDGSHFTILGMPLLPLLAALRDRRIVAS